MLARTGAATARGALDCVRYGPARTGALCVADAVPAALRPAAEAKLPDVEKLFADAKKSSDGYRLLLIQHPSQANVSVESPHGRKVAFAKLKARIEAGPRVKSRTDQIQAAGGWQEYNALAFGAACEAIADLASARRAFEEQGFSSLPRVAVLLDAVGATYPTHAAHLAACQAALTSLVTDRTEHSSSNNELFAEGGVGVLFAPAGEKGNRGKDATDYYLATAHGEGRAAAIKAAGGAASVVKYASVEEAQRAYDSEALSLGLITNAARTPLEAARLGLAVCHFHGGNQYHHVYCSRGLWQAQVQLTTGSGREKRTKHISSRRFADAEQAAAYANVILQAVKQHDPERPCRLNLGVGVTVDQKYASSSRPRSGPSTRTLPSSETTRHSIARLMTPPPRRSPKQTPSPTPSPPTRPRPRTRRCPTSLMRCRPTTRTRTRPRTPATSTAAPSRARRSSPNTSSSGASAVRNVRFLAELGFVTIPPAADADLLHPFWLQAA